MFKVAQPDWSIRLRIESGHNTRCLAFFEGEDLRAGGVGIRFKTLGKVGNKIFQSFRFGGKNEERMAIGAGNPDLLAEHFLKHLR